MTGQQHISIEDTQPIKGHRGLDWVVTEDSWHQPGTWAISEQIVVHKSVSGDNYSVIGETERAVAARVPRCRNRYEASPWNIEWQVVERFNSGDRCHM
jgi:hypothetical protein